MDHCPECGYQRPSYNSCRNRHCPKCQTLFKERWIDAQKGNLLNVGYFHVVFTVPQELNLWIYRNQQDCYNLLFRCVTETIQELSADRKYLGAATGHTAVLHTWGQNLCFRPHIHCIVPGGGLTKLGKWLPSRKKFFLPVKVLSRKFRGKFLSLRKQRFPGIELSVLNECYHKEWVVYCKPPFRNAACVVEYLGRYTHRVAISNNRILKYRERAGLVQMARLPERQPLGGYGTLSRRIHPPVYDACFANRVHENSALWFSVQPWQAEETAHLQGTDGHITEKKRKALHGGPHPKDPRQKALSMPKLRLLRSASNRTRTTHSLLNYKAF